MSALVTAATMPLVAFYFNQVSWLGLFTNLVAVPLMGGVLVPMGLLAAFGHAYGEGGGLPFPSAIQWAMDSFVAALRVMSQLPGSEWHVAAPSLSAVLMFYGCLGAMWIGSRRRRTVWITSAGLCVLLCYWMWSPRVWLDDDRFRVTFLDVSQGDSAVLELPDGEVVLIDGGGSYERFDMGRGVVAPYLWNRGIRTIDYVIATHPQLDHVGGLAYVLRHFTVRHFWGTGDARKAPFYQRLQEALAEQGLHEHLARRRHDSITLGKCTLEVLNPPESGGPEPWRGTLRQEGHALNNRSVVTEVTCGLHRFLFMADVEAETLMRMSRDEHSGRVDVVKVPHHGAASSFQPDWLDRVSPRYAVISVGRHNAYGHPAPAVVQAYADRGTALYRTDRDGGVWVTGKCSAPEVRIHLTSELQAQRVPFARCLWACEHLNWERLLSRWRE
jgi:competence protein ComEC